MTEDEIEKAHPSHEAQDFLDTEKMEFWGTSDQDHGGPMTVWSLGSTCPDAGDKECKANKAKCP